MNEITLIVADDHPIFRQGVVDTLSLEKDFRVLAQAANGDEAIEIIRTHKPRVAVLDVNMPGMNGQQVTHQVTSEHLPTRVVLLTGYDDIEQAIHAVLAGAVGYCAKEISPDVLALTVRAVADGKYAVAGNIFTRRELDRAAGSDLDSLRPYFCQFLFYSLCRQPAGTHQPGIAPAKDHYGGHHLHQMRTEPHRAPD